MIEVDLPGGARGLLDPRGRRERGPVRVAQPRHPHRRRPGPGAPRTARSLAASGGARRRPRSRWAGRCTATEILEWDGPPAANGGYAAPGAELAKVDGHATNAQGVALLVLAADCLPVALASPRRVAMLHCGWGGLAKDIIGTALDDVRRRRPGQAAIGPGIGQCHYEVGHEVLDVFEDVRRRRRRADARPEGDRRGASCGPAGSTTSHDVGRCTYCEPDAFFSHRRDNGVTGRQGGMVWRAPA